MNSKAMPQRWPAENIWEAVVPHLPGFSVEILPEIDSTNTELMRRARGGNTIPFCWSQSVNLQGVADKVGHGWAKLAMPSLSQSVCPISPAIGRACHWRWA